MGRVDDAMRRAAEGNAATEPPAAAPDAEAMAAEPFPIELPEHRRRRMAPVSSPEPADAVPLRPAVVAAEAVAAASAAARPDKPASFEHLDARLAAKVVVDENMMPVSREQYRRLAAALHHAQAANGLKVVMVASAVAGEGKTLTASNLALTLSESYQRNVLLIDADLRRPSLHTLFKVDGSSGLSEGLTAVEERKLPLYQVSPRLTILPAGKPSADPMAGLTSSRMRRLIDEAKDGFDWVIIDTPPVGVMTDANLLGSMVDGAVLVIKADTTPYDLVQRAVEAIGRDRMVGVVLNRATVAVHASKYSYYNYYVGAHAQAAHRD